MPGAGQGGLAVELLVLLIPLAIWAFFIWAGITFARNKGRDPWLGGILGGVLGIFGLIILAIIPDNKEVKWRREADWRARGATPARQTTPSSWDLAEQMQSRRKPPPPALPPYAPPFCPHCNEVLTITTRFCPGCEAPVSAEGGTEFLPKTAPPKCRDCGFTLAASARFCPSCGIPVASAR